MYVLIVLSWFLNFEVDLPLLSKIVVIQGVGIKSITGVYSAYEEDFPDELASVMTNDEFEWAMTTINEAIATRWPCFTAGCFSVLCCPCSLGLSYYISYSQLEIVVNGIHGVIDEAINPKFRSKGVVFSFHKTCCSSHIEVEIESYDHGHGHEGGG